MELLTYVYNELAHNPEVVLLLIGLFFVSISAILVHMPARQVEIRNDKYTPVDSVTASKRKQRFS